MATEVTPPVEQHAAEEGGLNAAAPPLLGSRQARLRFDRTTLLRLVPLVMLLVFIVGFGETQKDNRLWINLGIEAMYIGAIALGVNILLGYTGLLSLGQAGFFVAGGYAGAVWAPEWGLSPWLGFPVAFAFGLLLGTILALMCCHLKGFYLTVVTLAFGGLLPALVVVLKSLLGGTTGRVVSEPLQLSNVPFSEDNPFLALYWLAAALLLITLFLSWNLVRSRWGRAYMAIRDSELAARSCGVNTYWYKVSSFAISAAIVATAGALAAQRFLLVSPAAGSLQESFRYVIIVALGGMGTLAGPILGAFGITFGFGISWVQDTFSQYQDILFGALALFGVATAPEGTMGNLRKMVRNAQLKRAKKGMAMRVKPVLEVPDEMRRPSPRAATAGADGAVDGDVVLQVTGLVKRFGGLAALADIDLTVRRHTVHAVIGPNGSGKTTLINVITGYYDATAGRITFAGDVINDRKVHQRNRLGIARTFQNLQVWRRMTVLENVMVGAHSRTKVGLSRSLLSTLASRREERMVRQKAWGLLHFVGLTAKAHEPAASLPFADQRRLEVARALASDPDLLLLDEPAAGMHPSEVRELVALIRRIRDSGVTVLIIEHHMDLVMDLSDVVSVLDYGQKIAEGTPDEVRSNQRVIEAYLGTENVA